MDETYTLQGATPGEMVEIMFEAFDIEANRWCNWDWVTVTNEAGDIMMPKACGSTVPPVLRTGENKVNVNFHSDGSVSATGFRIEWRTYIE